MAQKSYSTTRRHLMQLQIKFFNLKTDIPIETTGKKNKTE